MIVTVASRSRPVPPAAVGDSARGARPTTAEGVSQQLVLPAAVERKVDGSIWDVHAVDGSSDGARRAVRLRQRDRGRTASIEGGRMPAEGVATGALVKVAVFTGIETIVVHETPKPECESGGIVVRVMSCGICGSDVRNFHFGLRGTVTAQVMGHEIAGVVEEVGSRVERFCVGDRVAIAPDVSCGNCYYCLRGFVNLCSNHRAIGTHWPGGFGEYLNIPAEVLERGMVHPMAEGMSFDAAALAEPASSVLACQEDVGVSLGSTVAIFGTGTIGCLHIDVARARGAARIIVVGRRRLNLAERFGPDAVIDAGKQEAAEEIRRITGGLGADIAICANPAASTHAVAVESVRKRGTVVLFGGLPKNDPMTTIDGNLVHYGEIRIVGSFSYPARVHRQAIETVASGTIDASKYIDRTVSLDQIAEGFRVAESGKALKVMVHPGVH